MKFWFTFSFVLLLSASFLLGQAGGGGQTKENVSGWTVDTLKSHYDDIIKYERELSVERDTRYQERFSEQKDAIIKSDAATEKRFESVNEFRNQLRDQNTTFISRTEAISRMDAISAKIDLLSKTVLERDANNAGSSQTWGLLAAGIIIFCTVIGMIVTVIAFVFVVVSRKPIAAK